MSEHERNDLLDRLGEHYAPAPLDPPRAARIRAHAEAQPQGGRVRFGATLGAGGTLALAVLALLLLRAPAPPPGVARADPASVAWADELLFPEEMSAFPADDESAMLPDEYQALDELFLSGV